MNNHDPAPKRAKVFWSGRSQAVRLPKEFRIAGDVQDVEIRRKGNQLILELPAQSDQPDPWAWLDNLQPLDADVIAAIEEDEGPFDERPDIDAFFK